MHLRSEHSFFSFLFFGNFFYGFCAVALAIESSLQQRVPLNGMLFYVFLFAATVFYYNLAFSKIDSGSSELNPRQTWHIEHNTMFRKIHLFLLFASLILCLYLIIALLPDLSLLTRNNVVLFLLFPLSAILYYGINSEKLKSYNLRRIGWLKPFIIGFTWAGAVGVFPQVCAQLEDHSAYDPGAVSLLLFIKNFMYVSVLAIMFDIKDYARDYNEELKTFVVHFGLRKTLFFILVPMLLIGLTSFISFALLQHFHPVKILLNTLPFLLCIVVAFGLQKRRSIFFYLAVIDGLMLVKALCGIVAMTYF